MKYILTFTLLGIVVAGCSAQPSRDASVTESTQSNPDIANIAPEGKFTEEAPTGETDSALPVMTPNAPPILLTPIQGNDTSSSTPSSLSTENWKTFTRSALGVSLEYPSDWSVTEGTDSVAFTSPKGATIQLKLNTANVNNDEFKVGNQYCTSRTNQHHLTADICVDHASFTYIAQFALQQEDGSTQRLTLMTTTRATGEVFEAMFNSVQLTN